MATPQKVLKSLKALQSQGVKNVVVDQSKWKAFVAKNASAGGVVEPLAKTARAPQSSAAALKAAEPAKTFAAARTPASSHVAAPLSMSANSSAKAILKTLPAVAVPAGDKKTQWEWLREKVLSDPEILSHVHAGKKAVFGVGNIDSPILFCGEAPGAEEEEQGEPFVGRAGQLLTKIIEALGFARKDVYIANIMNWRPETGETSGNRPPTYEEMAKCLPYLKAQVAVVRPKVIVALGATATTGLLGPDPDRKMGSTRGNFFEFENTPVMVTYHPSYLLRNNTNAAKRVVWEDLLKVMDRLGLPVSDKQRKFFT